MLNDTEDDGWLNAGEQSTEPVDLGAFENACRELFEQRKVVEAIELRLSEESKKLEAMKSRVLKIMDAHHMEKHHVSGQGTIYTTDRLTYSMPKDPSRKSEFFKYLVRKGVFQDLVTVHSQTLNAFCKAEVEAAAQGGDSDVQIPGLDAPKHVVTLSMRKG